jgi:hypothetical protein
MPIKRRVIALAVAAAAMVALAIAATGASAAPTPQVVASGLDNPRHLTFSANGDLYVVEAGRGGTIKCGVEHPALGPSCFGFTGAVTLVSDSGAEERVVTGLPSIAAEGEALGPFDIAFTGNQKYVVSIGLGGDDGLRTAYGPQAGWLGTLLTGKLKQSGVSLFADVLANEMVANPDGTDIDTNPVGMVRDGEGYVLADAGGNAVVRASHKGTFTTVTPLPPGSALAPPFLGLPPGTQIPTDAVPTSVVQGPDGAYYISQLTGFPFEKGDANIWRVVPGQPATVWASGLTNLTDLAFAPDGSLYAVEISSNGLLTGPIGALVKITPGGSSHQTVIGGLFAPYGVAFGNGAAYVSTCTVCFGGGEVIKLGLG